MSRPLAKTSVRILVAASLLTFLGCSSLPTAPKSNLATGHTAVSEKVIGQTGELPEDTPPLAPVSTTVQINGLTGGVVHAGAFSVVIPPAAFVGTAQITVTQPDPGKLECDLGISPPSKNHFTLPVILTANCGGLLDKQLLSFSYISWFNPATGQWQKVAGSSVDVAGLSVRAPLWHFSQYRVEGRASW
jgi:hypothetical protein